jgi:acyl-CoA oxidase
LAEILVLKSFSQVQILLHAVPYALKAMTSTAAGEGLETCQRACGGHGYSSFAGIGSWHADYLPTLTWEGDNYLLTQQVSRYLLKRARQAAGLGPQALKSQNDTVIVLRKYLQRQETGCAFDILGQDSHIFDAFAWCRILELRSIAK